MSENKEIQTTSKETITIEKLKSEMEILKYAFEAPRVHLVNYISEQTSMVDISFEGYIFELGDETSKNSTKARNEQLEIIEKLKSYEQECLSGLPTNEFEESFSKVVSEKIKDLERQLDSESDLDKEDRLTVVRNGINKTFWMVQRKIFMDKTFRFKDSLEEMRRKLIIVENIYFGEKNKNCDCANFFTSEDVMRIVADEKVEDSIQYIELDECPSILTVAVPKDREECIYMGHLEIVSLDLDIFDGFANLKQLELYSNKISHLESNSFRGLLNLQELSLHCNQFKNLEPDIFNGLVSLKTLRLNHNQIESLDSNIFNGLKNLKNLHLNDNKFKSIDSNIFKELKKLVILNLHNNELTSLKSDFFKDLGNLKKIDLSFNKLSSLESNMFNGLAKLKKVELFDNPLPVLKHNYFKTVAGARVLY